MQDTIEITLPVSGDKVVIRNYTTHNDDEKAEQALYAGVAVEKDETDASKYKLPFINVNAAKQVYVNNLVQSIDGDTHIGALLGNLRTPDYVAIEEAVDKIVEDNSPKAKAASDNSKSVTTAK